MLTMLFGILTTLAQKDSFEDRLKLDTIHSAKMEQWEFNSTSISCLSDGLWEHVLPKSTVGTDKIILNRNELNYFLELDNVKIKTEFELFANPGHWENRFGKQIQTLTLSKPLHLLAIKDGKLMHFSVDSLVGLRYATYYPYGELDVVDPKMVPIVYQQKNSFDEHSPILFVSSIFLDYIDLNEAKVRWDTVAFGSEDMSGTRRIIGLDFNGDGQDEVLTFHETTEVYEPSEGDESSTSARSIIGLYFKNHWYRTSFWQEGPDGMEGF
ncbi:hypothetical protein [Flagellimonas marina]